MQSYGINVPRFVLWMFFITTLQADLVCSKGCTAKQDELAISGHQSICNIFNELINACKKFEELPLHYSCTYPRFSGPLSFINDQYVFQNDQIFFYLYDTKIPRHFAKKVFSLSYIIGHQKLEAADYSKFLRSGVLVTPDFSERGSGWTAKIDGQFCINKDLFYFSFYHPTSTHLFFTTLATDVQELFDLSYALSDRKTAQNRAYVEEDLKRYGYDYPTRLMQEWAIEFERSEEGLLAIKNIAHDCLSLIHNTNKEIGEKHRLIIDDCILHHQSCWAYYHRGFQHFLEGSVEEFLDDIDNFLQTNQTTQEANSLLPEIHFNKGFAEGEIGLYQQAIGSLSEAIRQNPQNKKAYFERAALYFETGEFDLSLTDYLKSLPEYSWEPDFSNSPYEGFAKGILMGAKKGFEKSTTEFIPSILGSLRGLGNLLWATAQHPIDAPIKFAKATHEFFNYLRQCDKAELAELLVPEMYQLITNWDTLDEQTRGELTGYCFTKYGTDILLPVAAAKGMVCVYAYRNLKAADKLLTLEALAHSPASKKALIQSANYWNAQRSAQLSNVKIIADLQNKHIPGKHNYKHGNSILTHPDPQQLLNRYAGTGQKVRGAPGKAGYKERIDCGEIIGYYLEESNPTQHPTTMGIIHYKQKGAHIVPAKPKK